MFGISWQEFLVIAAVALIVAGPEKLPEIARTLGQLIYKWRQTSNELNRALETSQDDRRPPEDSSAPAASPSRASARASASAPPRTYGLEAAPPSSPGAETGGKDSTDA